MQVSKNMICCLNFSFILFLLDFTVSYFLTPNQNWERNHRFSYIMLLFLPSSSQTMDSEPFPEKGQGEGDGHGHNQEKETASCPITPFFVCGFVILFNWDEGQQRPFKLFPRKAFPEITDYCLNKELADEFRIKKLCPLKPLPGKIMSLFAKVESSKIKKSIFIVYNSHMHFLSFFSLYLHFLKIRFISNLFNFSAIMHYAKV